MNKFYITKLTKDLAEELAKEEFSNLPLGDIPICDMMVNYGLSVAILQKGKVAAAMGVIPLWEGVGEAWAVLTNKIKENPLTLIRLTKDMISRAQETMCLHRIQVSVVERDYNICRWIKSLGFHSEGVMEKFGPDGNNHIRYVRIY